MCTNFNFLKDKKLFDSFSSSCIEAEKGILVSPANCAMLSRKALELAVKWVYTFDDDLTPPYRDNLTSLILNKDFSTLVNEEMLKLLKYIVTLGNDAVHTNASINRNDAILSLYNLHQFISWIDYYYADEYSAKDFDKSLLLVGEETKIRLEENLNSKDKKLEELLKENLNLKEKLTDKRKENSKNYDFNLDKLSKPREIPEEIRNCFKYKSELELPKKNFLTGLVNNLCKSVNHSFDLKELILFYSSEINKQIIKIEKKENLKHRGGCFQIKYLEDCIEICIHNYFETHNNKAIAKKSNKNIKHKYLNPISLEKLKHKQVLKFEILPPT